MTTEATLNADRLYSKPEVCAILGISSMTLERRMKDGTIVPVRIGKAVRFTKESIKALKEKK
jgi:excisionase family DNA binding protein